MLAPHLPLALYMAGASTSSFGKMGYGILRYSPNPVACVIDPEHAGEDMLALGMSPRACPIVASVTEAAALGAKVFVLGIAPPGGLIPEDWRPAIDQAVSLGLSLVNGLHEPLAPRYPNLATGQFVWDIRREPAGLDNGTGAAAHLPNRRVLMVGTDMAVGKMTAGLEFAAEARRRGISTGFVATGQIGITITGAGIPLDAVRVDYASGAVEREVLSHRDAELVVVEGQGSLVHPASTATLPLLRGACPTHLILCHRAGQTTLARPPKLAIPPLGDLIRLYEDLASVSGTFPRPVTLGICLNTSHLPDAEARAAVEDMADEVGLPCTDPVRFGVEELLDRL